MELRPLYQKYMYHPADMEPSERNGSRHYRSVLFTISNANYMEPTDSVEIPTGSGAETGRPTSGLKSSSYLGMRITFR